MTGSINVPKPDPIAKPAAAAQAVSFNALLEKYKKIYFDADYYLAEKVKAYNANREGGRADWTVEALGVSDAWADFSASGAFYQYKNADGETVTGINPSQFFDVNRYYRDKGGVTKTDPISDYAQFIATQYLGDQANVSMPVVPTRVGLEKIVIDGVADYQPNVAFTPYAWPKKADDEFTNGLQYTGIDWNYIGLTQGNVLYYSIDQDMSWIEANPTYSF